MLDIAEAQLELRHIQFIVRALHDLARTDGLHEAERAMLKNFYEQCRDETHALASYDDLVGVPFDPTDAAELFHDDGAKVAFLHSCLLLAYADGACSSGERAKIAAFATALDVPEADLVALEEAVRDHLMQQISQIENLDALQEVARELVDRD